MNHYNTNDTPRSPSAKKSRGGVFFTVLFLLALIAGGGWLVYEKAFVGSPSTDVTLTSAVLTDRRLELSGYFNGFAGMKDYTFEAQEDTVTIQLTSVWPLAGAANHFDILVYGEFSGISEVNLTDGSISRVVWSADDNAETAEAG